MAHTFNGWMPIAAARFDANYIACSIRLKSIQRSHFPTRRAAAARAAPSTPRLTSAARVGPVVYGLHERFVSSVSRMR